MKKQTPFPATGDLRPLVDRAQAGDQAAFTELYEQTSTDLYRIVHAMVRDEDMTWDILQNTYVRVYRSLPTLRDSNAFWPWLRQIAVNETATQTAQQLPLNFSDVSGAEDQAFEIPDERSEVQPELSLDRKETARLVQEILDGLSDGQRLLVGMYYFQELPIREIAERLAITPGTVKKQLARSRTKIEDAVKRLEKQGVKLYGLSPLPFLLALLRRQEPAAEAEKAALAKTVETVGLRAGAKAAAPVAEAVGVHVGRPFFETGLGRVVLGVLSVAVIGGGVLVSNVLDNRSYGDVRPPESIETAEDLSTEPTEPVPTRPDTAEDLVTEPETTEPVTTEPEAPTDTAQPAAPSNSEEPSTSESSSRPTESSERETQPTEPQPRTTVHWDNSADGLDWHAQAGPDGYTSRTLCVTYPYTDNIQVYTDSADILSITQSETPSHSIVSDQLFVDSKWSVTPLAEGTAQVFVKVDDTLVQALNVTVQTSPSIYDVVCSSFYFDGYGEEALRNCAVGTTVIFYVYSVGQEFPVVSTSNSAVARVDVETSRKCAAPVFHHTVTVAVVGTGDAVISLTQGDTTYKSWSVHSSAYECDWSDSQEDLIPFEAPPQVMSWYIDGSYSSRPILFYAGRSESLYVKVKGTEPPTIVSDDPSVISVSAASSEWYEERNVTEFWYTLKANRSGTCTVSCYYNEGRVFAIQLLVP